MRLKVWKMKPIEVARTPVSWLSRRAGRQTDEAAVPPDLMAVFVEFQAGDAQPRGRSRAAGPPQYRPDAFEHLVQAERLGDVVVSAQGQAGDTLADAVASAQEDDRDVRAR